MRRSQGLASALNSGGFLLHSLVRRRFRVSFINQCLLTAAVPVVAVVIGSLIDGTLFLPGQDVGLLEHPAFWSSIGLQIALPISLRHSLECLVKSGVQLRIV